MIETLKIIRDDGDIWESENPILSRNELGLDTTANRIKIGDGASEWCDLEYVGPDIINSLVKGGKDAALSAEQGKVLKSLVDKKANASDIVELSDNFNNDVSRLGNDVSRLESRVDALERVLKSALNINNLDDFESALESFLAGLNGKIDDAPRTGKYYVRRNGAWEPTEAITSVVSGGVSLLIPGTVAKTAIPNVTAGWSSYTVPTNLPYLVGLALAGDSDTVFVTSNSVQKSRISCSNSTYGDVYNSFTFKDWQKVTQTTNTLPSHVVNASCRDHIARTFMLGNSPDQFGTNLYYYGYVNGENPVKTNLVDSVSALAYAYNNDMLCALVVDYNRNLVPYTSTVSGCNVWTAGNAITTLKGSYHGLRLCWNPVMKMFYMAVNDGSECRVYRSSNGFSWDKSTSISEKNGSYTHALVTSDKLPWVFAGGDGFAKYTKDGETWNYCHSLNGHTVTSGCYAADLGLYCFSVKGAGLMISPDFETWFSVSLPAGCEYFTDMEFSKSRSSIIAVSENAKTVFVLPIESSEVG